jgi:hypothetical protein
MRSLALSLFLTAACCIAVPALPAAMAAPAPDAAPPAPAPDPAPAPSTATPPPPAAPPPTAPPVEQSPAPATEPVPAEPAPVEPAPAEAAPAEQAPPAPPARQRPSPDRPGPERSRPVRQTVDLAGGLATLEPRFLAEEDDGGDGGPLARAALALLLLVIAGAASLRLTVRLAGPTTLLLLLVLPAAAQAEDVAARCDTSAARDGCNRWYRAQWVSLSWTYDAGGMIVSGCGNGVFSAETRPQRRSCTVRWGGTSETREVWIGVDRTPPAVTAMTPDRPADHNGWFTHPVGLLFKGSDAVSGVASCGSASFGGPDGAGIPIAGTCSDVAGNSATRSFPLNYDATPPGPPTVEAAVPGDRRVRVEWAAPPDAASVEVVRLAPGAPLGLYNGPARDLVDRGLENGVRHRYRLTAIDPAGNRASVETSAVPKDLPPLLTWKRRKKASYYNVQLFRAGRKILSRWPKVNRLQLERRWRYAGRRRRLVPGRYVWYVWPGYGERSARDYGKLLRKRSFRIAG